jgi:hypothetical protein
MIMIKLIAICFVVLPCSLVTAQDPQLVGKDGLPATKSPHSENYHRNSESQESRRRNRTVDRTQEQVQIKEDEFSTKEVQKENHFKSDTITMRSFEEKKRVRTQQPGRADTVKTTTRKPPTSSGVRRPTR